MPCAVERSRQLGESLNTSTDAKERRSHAHCGQGLGDPLGGGRVRTIVEGERHFGTVPGAMPVNWAKERRARVEHPPVHRQRRRSKDSEGS
jgi:hypothetical protein